MLEKILDGCERLFRRFGIKSLSMDDISRELGISKKTLYQHVTDKNDLVRQTFKRIFNSQKHRCHAIGCETDNPVEEILLISREVSARMKGTNPAVFFDLQKYHPDVWQIFRNFSSEFVYSQLKNNLEAGKARGYYRDDLNPDIIARLYISMMQFITTSELIHEDYNFNTLYQEMIRYHLQGICTPLGLKIIQEKPAQNYVL